MSAPTRYDQTPDGCWVACIAGLTGLPHDDLARFVPRLPDGTFDGSMGTEYHNAINTYLRANGWRLERLGSDCPMGFAIGSGTSPRGMYHACITLAGALWHDPHPSRAGCTFTDFEVLIPIVPLGGSAWEQLRRLAPDCYAFAQMAHPAAARHTPAGGTEP